jgi:PhnB protein
MARVCTYLNLPGTTGAAFEFYRSIFRTQYEGEGIRRMGDALAAPGQALLSEADKRLVMHVALPILGGHVLMGTDAVDSMGFHTQFGNNIHISLQTDSRSEADYLFEKLSDGGKVDRPLMDMFWGEYFGSLTDQFGVKWMVSHRMLQK